MTTPVLCHKCGNECNPDGIAAGYAVDKDGNKYCYPCTAQLEEAELIERGTGYLYLVKRPIGKVNESYHVTNWTSHLDYDVKSHWTGRHNIADIVYFVRFIGPDGKVWSGKTVGDFTQICHVKRTKLSSVYAS